MYVCRIGRYTRYICRATQRTHVKLFQGWQCGSNMHTYYGAERGRGRGREKYVRTRPRRLGGSAQAFRCHAGRRPDQAPTLAAHLSPCRLDYRDPNEAKSRLDRISTSNKARQLSFRVGRMFSLRRGRSARTEGVAFYCSAAQLATAEAVRNVPDQAGESTVTTEEPTCGKTLEK